MKIRPSPPVKQNESPSSSRPEMVKTGTAGSRSLSFAAGQTVTGRVLEFRENGYLLLAIGGRTVTARAALSLPVGEEFQFTVSRGGDIPWLSLKDDGPVHQLFRLLATDAMASLAPPSPLAGKELAELLALPSSPPQLATMLGLQALLTVSENTPLESVLLVALLLAPPSGKRNALSPLLPDQNSLTAALEQVVIKDSGFSPQQRKSLQSLAELGRMLSLGEEVNRQAGLRDATNLFIFPLFYGGKAGWGEWLLRFEGQKSAAAKSRGGGVLLDFFLDMSNLGQLQFSMILTGNSIRGTFLLEDRHKVDHLSGHLKELKSSLEEIGYSIRSLHCGVMRQNNGAALKYILEKNSGIPNLSLIDLNA